MNTYSFLEVPEEALGTPFKLKYMEKISQFSFQRLALEKAEASMQ